MSTVTAALQRRRPTSGRTSCDSWCSQGHAKTTSRVFLCSFSANCRSVFFVKFVYVIFPLTFLRTSCWLTIKREACLWKENFTGCKQKASSAVSLHSIPKFCTHAVCCNSLRITLRLHFRFLDPGTRLTDVVETLLAVCCIKHIKLCVSNRSTQFQLVFHRKRRLTACQCFRCTKIEFSGAVEMPRSEHLISV
jgi:hypothetical protein